MRTRSIIYIIRRYGLSSKRLNPKHPIKYEDAIKGLESYENADLKIVDVIDNVLFPHKSVSKHCQVPGCNHAIRYEYVLEDKNDGRRFVAGSTCVWPTLGMSELQKKEFLTYEAVVKEYHEMLQWSKDHPDLVEKLEKAKAANLYQFKPFWREIEHCALMDEDTEYLQGVDIDRIIESKNKKEQELREARQAWQLERAKSEEEYRKVVDGINMLADAYPDNGFYASLRSTANSGARLSPKQIRCIKVGCNKKWYEDKVKGPSRDQIEHIYHNCEEILSSLFGREGFQGPNSSVSLVRHMNEVISALTDKNIKLAWNCFKVKYEIVL